jgi:4-amino-4-deoxy-L-arabinose transferase-like glycosyltransferase
VSTRIGLFELPDGFFYIVLGVFLYTGKLLEVYPFNATIPQTLFGPVYATIAYVLLSIPYPFIFMILPFFQFICIGLAAICVYQIAKIVFHKQYGYLSVTIFFTLPLLFIYATTLTAESLTIFLVSLFTLLLLHATKSKKPLPWMYVFSVAAILTLTKNAFIFSLPITLLVACWQILRYPSIRKPSTSHIIPYALVIMTSVLLLRWLLFNYQHHHIIAFTNYTGRHLYNNVVHQGKFLPPENSDVYKSFTRYMGNPQKELLLPEWEVQTLLVNDFKNGTLTESQMDREFLAFSIAAIKHHPVGWIFHISNTALHNVITPPYHRNLLPFLGMNDGYYHDPPSDSCRIPWNTYLCKMPGESKFLNTIWGTFLTFQVTYYPIIMGFYGILAAIGILRFIVKKQRSGIILTGIFLLFWIIPAMAQQIEGRYFMPVFPLFAVLISSGILSMKTVFSHVSLSLKQRQNTIKDDEKPNNTT